MRIIETPVYTYDEHPNKPACLDWVRENWQDLDDPTLEDAARSLDALAVYLECQVDWSLSNFRDHGYIRFKDVDDCTLGELFKSGKFNKQILDMNCPLTGHVFDEVLLDAFRYSRITTPLKTVLKRSSEDIVQAVIEEVNFINSDENLEEFVIANGYEFKKCGSFYSD